MTYALDFTPVARKQFSKLEKGTQQRIVTALERIQIRPYPHVVRLVGNLHHRLRVGDYRVILDIQDVKLLILVIEVGHRKRIYD